MPPGVPLSAPSSAKAWTRLAVDVAEKIVRGELAAGDALPAEGDLVIGYGLSRAVVREALRLLEHDGLVSIQRGANGGVRVRAPGTSTSARYVGLLLQLRGTTLADLDAALVGLEPEAVRIVATARPPAGLALLRAVHESSRADDLRPKDLSAFHAALGPATGNRVIGALFEVVTGISARHSDAAATQSTRPDRVDRDLRRAHRFHSRVIDLIETGEVDDAVHRWRRHGEIAARALAQDPSASILDLFHGQLSAMDWEGGSAIERSPSRLPKGADLVAGEFRRRIASGSLHEGDALPTETEIMAEFRLSRAPVREAIRVLEADGLIVMRRGSHRGGLVHRPQPAIAAWHLGVLLEHRASTLGELLEARLVLGRVAATLVRPSGFGNRSELQTLVTRATGKGSTLERLGAYGLLHDQLVAATGNTTLQCLNSLVSTLVRRHLSRLTSAAPRRGSAELGRLRATAVAVAEESSLAQCQSAWLQWVEALDRWSAAVLDERSALRVFGARPA